MTGNRALVVALCGGIALLAVLGRVWLPGAAVDDRRPAERGAGPGGSLAVERRGANRPPAGAGGSDAASKPNPTERRSAPGGPVGAGGGAMGVTGNRLRSGPRGTGAMDAAGRDRGARRALPERLQQGTEPQLTRPNVPPPGADGTQTDDGASEELAEDPIPDVSYDGGDRVFDTASQAEIDELGEISGEAGTIAFWVEPQWESQSQDGASFVQLGDGLRLIKDGNLLRFEYPDGAGGMNGGEADIGDWNLGDRRHVAATWNGATLSLFVDGSQLFLNTASIAPRFGGPMRLYVGTGPSDGAPVAIAQLQHLTLMKRNISSDEVRQLFESGGQR